MEEIKALLKSLVDGSLKASNEKDLEKDDKAKNEDTDKRKLIDEVGGILKGKVDEELWRTVIGKIEKIAYTKSEAGTADNKCKNEDEEKEEKKEKFEEFKKDVEEEAENKKAKNSIDEFKEGFFSGKVETSTKFMSQKDGIELGKKLY